MLETLSTEKKVEIITTNKNIKIGISSGVFFNLIYFSTKSILVIQTKKASETKKKRRYCLLNSKLSKEKGKKNNGSRKTSKIIFIFMILLSRLFIFKLYIFKINNTLSLLVLEKEP